MASLGQLLLDFAASPPSPHLSPTPQAYANYLWASATSLHYEPAVFDEVCGRLADALFARGGRAAAAVTVANPLWACAVVKHRHERLLDVAAEWMVERAGLVNPQQHRQGRAPDHVQAVWSDGLGPFWCAFVAALAGSHHSAGLVLEAHLLIVGSGSNHDCCI
eukprot:60368-Chlamydomonas_euryale.AAC.2